MNIVDWFRQVFTTASQHPVLERLLVASLELIAVTALVLAIIHIARVRSNRVVALMWLVAAAKPVVGLALGDPAPAFNFGSLGIVSTVPVASEGTTGSLVASVTEAGFRDGTTTLPAVVGSMSQSFVSDLDPARAIVGAWLVGAGLLALLSIADRLRIRQLIRAARAPSRRILSLYAEAAGETPVSRLPQLLITDRLESPAIAGTFSPVVFLPQWMADNLDRERVVWSLRHEITHWRHRDHLAGFVGEIARILFFFHPLVWWVGKKWKEASEIACDQAMVGNRRDARHYAEQLYQILARVHTRRRVMVTTSMFATRTQIGKRIELLLKSRPLGSNTRRFPAAVFLLAFTALVFSLGAEIAPQAESTTIVVKSDDDKPASVVATIHEDDGRNISIVIRGEVEFNDDRTDVKSISSNGSLQIVETHDGVVRELEIIPTDSGDLEWIYKVDDENQPFDDEAKEWFSSIAQYLSDDDTDDVVVVKRPRVTLRTPLVVKTSPRVKIRVDESGDVVTIREGEATSSVIRMTIDDDEDSADIWISAEAQMEKDGDHVNIALLAGGRLMVEVKRDGDRHRLEIVPGDGDEREYIYKLNGEKRPYDDEAKKIFDKYLEQLEDGYKLYPGERI